MPSLRRIVCLANSRKHGEHCVAGIDLSTGKWIRPVSDLDDGRLTRKMRLVNGREPELLDILQIRLADSGPDFGFESENLSVLPVPWVKEGKVSPADVVQYCSPGPHILHNSENYVPVPFMESLPLHERRTLQVIETVRFSVSSTGLSAHGGHKWQASLATANGAELTAMITDPVFVEKLESGHQPQDHCLVSVSLSMPWRPDDWPEDKNTACWKLIAAVIEMTDKEEGGADDSTRVSLVGAKRMDRSFSIDSARKSLRHTDVMSALKKVFGFDSFRSNQQEIIHTVLEGRDAFVVMPTGGGKSLCYQLPACLLPGTCMVISPLISLMKDQVDAARGSGIQAECFNSSLSERERIGVLRKLSSGNLDLIYVAPERFAMDVFFNNLKRVPLCLFAIDEAHCISEWGHDFRPDYLFLSEIVKHFADVPVAAFTATATRRVQKDIIERLGLRDPHIVRASFDRPNLFYKVVPKDDVRRQILEFLKTCPHDSGIVYRTTRDSVENTAAYLSAHGINALPYHAGLDNELRRKNQDAFSRDEVRVIVATIAFGMGIDKSDVRFVLHGDIPKNIESYYQETGRAGRDGEPADCVLFFGGGDFPKIRYFIDQMENDTEREIAVRKLNQMAQYASVNACRRRQLLSYFGESYEKDNCVACDVCMGEVEQVDAATDAQIVMSAIVRSGQRFGVTHVVDVVTGADTQRVRDLRHNEIKTYGAGKEKDQRHWRRIIDDLIAQECIVQTDDRYPVLHLTEKGRNVLQSREDFRVIRQKRTGKKQKAPVTEDYDLRLFEKLRALRREIAAMQNVPPFVVFSDKTLHEMAQYFPTKPDEMNRITGVGERKLEQYGDQFMALIRSYTEQNPEIVRTAPPAMPLPALKSKKKEQSKTVETTWQLLQDGMTYVDIAKERKLTPGTIAGHIEKLILQGRDIDPDVLVPVEKRLEVERLFSCHGTESLKTVVEASDGRLSYEDARIVRAIVGSGTFYMKE